MTPVMTGLEKVAVLLKSLPAPIADKVMRHLDARHASLLRAELAKVDKHADLPQKLSGVLDEAVNMLHGDSPDKERTPRKTETVAAAQQMPASARSASSVDIRVGDSPESKTSAAPTAPPVPTAPTKPALAWPLANADPLRALAGLPSELLASALDTENARTVSLLMDCLEIEVAGQIYKRLSPAKRKEVSLRFTQQTAVGEELIKRIAQGVLKKCETLREAAVSPGAEQGGREKRMAALLRELERADRLEMLTALGESDAELTARVKALLYQFEDILRMENTSVQKMLSEVDVKSLSLALRGAPEDIESKILANLSKRAQESLKEEISLTGAVPAAKVRAARQGIEEAIQRLDQRGELIMLEEG